MKNNRLTQSDIGIIRRRLDLLLKDCARYMTREQPEFRAIECEKCLSLYKGSKPACARCNNALTKEAYLLTLLRGIGIYDTGVHPPTMPKGLRQLRGRMRIIPAPKVVNHRKSKTT